MGGGGGESQVGMQRDWAADVLVSRVEQVFDLDGPPQGGEGRAAARGAQGAVLLVADLCHVSREVDGDLGESHGPEFAGARGGPILMSLGGGRERLKATLKAGFGRMSVELAVVFPGPWRPLVER